MLSPVRTLPRLTQARESLTHEVTAINEHGQPVQLFIPVERSLTVYVDKQEIVTLMTLGMNPEQLVLGWLRNQRLVESVYDIDCVTVDWEVGAAAVRTRSGIASLQEKTSSRVVTTGCGQGSVFGAVMDGVSTIKLGASQISQAQIYTIVNTIRTQESIYKKSGSVHGCALFSGNEELVFIEDVGRHNAIDTIAGWMWMNSVQGEGKVFYTTGRLTSEMIIKAAQMGIGVVISRSGITQMGLQVADQLGLCAIGRALNKRFLCYSAPERLVFDPTSLTP